MKKLKPFILGSVAGAGLMFGSLNYHVVRSHNGLQLIPRTPQPSLGLAFADVRDWDAQQWSDRSVLARALVAHGSSDLIAQSVVDNVTRSINEDGGTVERLRALLNDSRKPTGDEQDIPRIDLFERNEGDGESEDRGLFIPFPKESRRIDSIEDPVNDPFGDFREDVSERWHRNEASRGSQGVLDSLELLPPSRPDSSRRPSRPGARYPFGGTDTGDDRRWDNLPAIESPQESRRREMDSVEDSLFGDDVTMDLQDTNSTPADSLLPSDNSRAERVLERARQELRKEVADAAGTARNRMEGYVRDSIRLPLPDSRKPQTDSPPKNLSAGGNDDVPIWDNVFDQLPDLR